MLRRAEKLRTQERPKAVAAVVAALAGTSNAVAEPAHQPLEVDGKQMGRWSRDGAGRLTVQIEADHLNDDRHLAVLKSISAAPKA